MSLMVSRSLENPLVAAVYLIERMLGSVEGISSTRSNRMFSRALHTNAILRRVGREISFSL